MCHLYVESNLWKLSISGMSLSHQSDLPASFGHRRVNLKTSYQFQLTSSRNHLSRKKTLDCCFHQILYLANSPIGQFRFVISRDLANLGKSSSGIRPLPSKLHTLHTGGAVCKGAIPSVEQLGGRGFKPRLRSLLD
jgi:hypothetical protein